MKPSSVFLGLAVMVVSSVSFASSYSGRDLTGLWKIDGNHHAVIVQNGSSISVGIPEINIPSAGISGMTFTGTIKAGSENTFSFNLESQAVSFNTQKHGICTMDTMLKAEGTVLGEFPNRSLNIQAMTWSSVSCKDGFMDPMIMKDMSGDWT